MKPDYNTVPSFLDIVFENRNRNYGAYLLRKKYSRNIVISLITGILIMSAALIIPYINARVMVNQQKRTERTVEIRMENLDTPLENVVPPPAPPPPPEEAVQTAKYIPPVVVDSVKPEEVSGLMTVDQAVVEVKNEDVLEVVEIVREEVTAEVETEQEPFTVVEEMPMFPGGDEALLKYVLENTIYPKLAMENNIQGRVIVRFCVTPKGGVDQISIFKGVDPELDAEAIRVVKTLPLFKPGKQGGKPVPVWFILPINYQLK
jgi:protein TonB